MQLALRTCGLLLLLLACGGGIGCSRDNSSEEDVQAETDQATADEESNAEEKQPLPDFEVVRKPTVLPFDEDSKLRGIKPGHMSSSIQQVVANNADEYADVKSLVVDTAQQPLAIPRTGYWLSSEQPTAFAKGEVETIETEFFFPRRTGDASQQSWISTQLLSRSGRELLSTTEPTTAMPACQYYFVVVASHPTDYAYLNGLDAIDIPADGSGGNTTTKPYRVVLPDLTLSPVPLPSNSLAWTSIAYLLWDEIDPNELSRAQQKAMLDWLHWGGQLIISGPDSLEQLRDSFLAPYLPAEKKQSRSLKADHFSALNRFWNVGTAEQRRQRALKPSGNDGMLGIEMTLNEPAQFISTTGDLVAERQVGRGRVVLTAFSLTDRAVKSWSNLGSFFNGCLMRRPRRKFSQPLGSIDVSCTWQDFPTLHQVPLLSSTVRYFSRDLTSVLKIDRSDNTNSTEPPRPSLFEQRQATSPRELYQTAGVLADPWHFGGYGFDEQAGVAGWSEESGVLRTARRSLTEAAGIEPPSSKFVLSILFAYLIVLVPVNWAVFRMLRRVEWAWLAVPAIAILGTVFVVRSAQLDIGFVRSRTEISVMEIHADYNRAHISRFTALYSSLSTRYDLSLSEPTSAAVPLGFSGVSETKASDEIVVRHERERIIRGFRVPSNSTGLLHTEQMVSLAGPLRVEVAQDGGVTVRNLTGLTIREAGVMWRSETDLQVAWLGDIAPDAVRQLEFTLLDGAEAWLAEWNQSPIAQSDLRRAAHLLERLDKNRDSRVDRGELAEHPELLKHYEGVDRPADVSLAEAAALPGLDRRELAECCRRSRAGEINLGRFFDLAVQQLQLGRGEMRMLGWMDEPLEGIELQPAPTQRAHPCFVIAHLRPPTLAPARPDVNLLSDVDDPTRPGTTLR